MCLNTSLLFIEGGSLDLIEFKEKLSLVRFSKYFHIYKIVGEDGSVKSKKCDSGSYVIYEIDTTTVDGEVYPRIYIAPFSIIRNYTHYFKKPVLFIGSDLNNQIEIDSIDDIPYVNSQVDIFFGNKNPLNGCYRVTSIDTVNVGGIIYPRIHTRERTSDKILKNASSKFINLSLRLPSMILGW